MKNYLPLLLVLVLFFGVWDLGWKMAGVPPLLPWQLKRMLREKPENVLLVDVRTPVEYNLFHIPGAVNLPELLKEPQAPPGDGPNKVLVVICMTGHRSPVAAKTLQDKTQAKVVNLTWGMLGWVMYFGPVTR